MKFICGNCARKKNLSLADRLLLAERIEFGKNPCSECERVVIGKFQRSKDIVKRQVKPIPRENGTVQIGLFVGFNSFNQ